MIESERMLVAKTDILGVGFDNVDMAEAVSAAEKMLEGGCHYIVTPNSEIVYDCLENPELRSIINKADLVIPDGAGVVKASHILETPLKEKVAGVELAEKLLAVMARRGASLYLLGAKPGVAERAAAKMKQLAPGLVIAGTRDGYFKEDSDAVEAVRQAAPDVVYVCLGSPRQEQFIAKHLEEMDCRIAIGLGGSLDIFAGEAKRAPKIFIKLGLEWFYRLLKQPSRLGRMMRLPKFLREVKKEKKRRDKEVAR